MLLGPWLKLLYYRNGPLLNRLKQLECLKVFDETPWVQLVMIRCPSCKTIDKLIGLDMPKLDIFGYEFLFGVSNEMGGNPN